MKRQVERILDKEFLGDKPRTLIRHFLEMWRKQVTAEEDLQAMAEGKWLQPTVGEFTDFATRYCIDREDLSFEEQQELLQATCSSFLAATWELAKPLYKFDKTLSADLSNAFKQTSNIPCSVLEHLPYWASMVDNPDGADTCGFVSSYTPTTEGAGILCILPLRIHGRSKLYNLVVEKDHRTIADIIDHNVKVTSSKSYKRMNKERLDALKLYLTNCVGKMVYLCSEKPDISGHIMDPGKSYNYSPGTKQKFRPPKEARVIGVGMESGKQIRAQLQRLVKKGLDRKAVKAHVREGHWHGFWTGKRDGSEEQVYISRWVNTTFVNLLK